MNVKICFCLFSLLFLNHSYAAVSLDRTRAIFPGDKNSIVLNIENTNDNSSYLAQSWLEDDNGKKIEDGALVALPPLQSLAPKTKSVVQINKTGFAEKLPLDRESLFYFNLREIPPKAKEQNVLQVALQTNIKLFYRPSAILDKANTTYQRELILTETSQGYKIKNPTPFHITIIGIGKTAQASLESDFSVVMIKPFGEIEIKSKKLNHFFLTYIDDFGGKKSIPFSCQQAQCVATKD
ncbi:fimbrial biogenesis chaperone [Providencia stuartii]|uniref:fimbrial biogenesis chaperone n=1 Tax=Providencia stuartii TaxID=588 RepID=UPI0024AB491A|nr:molecular chaperone [Providencia stuartii]MCX3071373.1 molecular chaperone [Providencia stuartii]